MSKKLLPSVPGVYDKDPSGNCSSSVSSSQSSWIMLWPQSSVHGILQARILAWVAIPFSRGSAPPRDWTQISCIAGRFFYHLNHQVLPVVKYFDHSLPPELKGIFHQWPPSTQMTVSVNQRGESPNPQGRRQKELHSAAARTWCGLQGMGVTLGVTLDVPVLQLTSLAS